MATKIYFLPGKSHSSVQYSTQETKAAIPYALLWLSKKLSDVRFWGLITEVTTNSEKWKKDITEMYL